MIALTWGRTANLICRVSEMPTYQGLASSVCETVVSLEASEARDAPLRWVSPQAPEEAAVAARLAKLSPALGGPETLLCMQDEAFLRAAHAAIFR